MIAMTGAEVLYLVAGLLVGGTTGLLTGSLLAAGRVHDAYSRAAAAESRNGSRNRSRNRSRTEFMVRADRMPADVEARILDAVQREARRRGNGGAL